MNCITKHSLFDHHFFSPIHFLQSALSALLQSKSVTCTSSSAVLTSLAHNSQNSHQGAVSLGTVLPTTSAPGDTTSGPGDMYYTYLMAQAAQQERARQQHMLKMLGFVRFLYVAPIMFHRTCAVLVWLLSVAYVFLGCSFLFKNSAAVLYCHFNLGAFFHFSASSNLNYIAVDPACL
jgi:hypothetical protein